VRTTPGLESCAVWSISAATEVTPEIVEAFARLMPLLSQTAPAPTAAEIEDIITCPATTLLLARDGEGGPIAGTLTLAVFPIPSGVRAWIEDVIVAQETRGRGCGEALTRAAIEVASTAGARTVDLTSRPSREAANRLYQRVGFAQRETSVYRYELDGESR
jgi:ribosomal protein S18 acetylase RimI-like enzyme